MTPHLRYGLIGVVIGLILFWINPLAAIVVLAAAVAIPVIAYRMLSPEQRRRLRRRARVASRSAASAAAARLRPRVRRRLRSGLAWLPGRGEFARRLGPLIVRQRPEDPVVLYLLEHIRDPADDPAAGEGRGEHLPRQTCCL